jgi:ADP-heptose:LPS heptosyltransferase
VPLHLLGNADAAVIGLSLRERLEALRPDTVRVDFVRSGLREAMWSLPLIDALSRRFLDASISFRGSEDTVALLDAHLCGTWKVARSRRVRIDSPGLIVELKGARTTRARLVLGRTDRLVIPSAPFPRRQQHASAHRIDGGLAAGLDVSPNAPVLRLPDSLHLEARSLARKLAGRSSGPLVGLIVGERGGWGPERFAGVLAELVERIGARGIAIGSARIKGAVHLPDTLSPPLRAALLRRCAVCVGDDTGWSHVAAAVGAPIAILHGATDPLQSGPASAVVESVYTSLCHHRRRAGARCLACLSIEKVAAISERLAATRWPWDRIERLLPG